VQFAIAIKIDVAPEIASNRPGVRIDWEREPCAFLQAALEEAGIFPARGQYPRLAVDERDLRELLSAADPSAGLEHRHRLGGRAGRVGEEVNPVIRFIGAIDEQVERAITVEIHR